MFLFFTHEKSKPLMFLANKIKGFDVLCSYLAMFLYKNSVLAHDKLVKFGTLVQRNLTKLLIIIIIDNNFKVTYPKKCTTNMVRFNFGNNMQEAEHCSSKIVDFTKKHTNKHTNTEVLTPGLTRRLACTDDCLSYI